MPTCDPFLIVGASTRAAAFSAIRSGMQTQTADLFSDWDLKQHCLAFQIPSSEYPHGLHDLFCRIKPTTWMYTGALENYPTLIDQLASKSRLIGNPGYVLRRARDPFLVRDTLQKAAIPHLEVTTPKDAHNQEGLWLLKPFRSAGGSHIQFLDQVISPQLHNVSRNTTRSIRRPLFCQKWLSGPSVTAIYLSSLEQVQLIGVTKQLVGERSFHARSFSYCGSIGPLPLEASLSDKFLVLGNTLSRTFGLRGVWGLDCVLSNSTPYAIEINPRWSASLEVIERALNLDLFTLHVNACEQASHSVAFDQNENTHANPLLQSSSYTNNLVGTAPCVGKAILYADRDRIAPEPSAWFRLFDLKYPQMKTTTNYNTFPYAADIPNKGELIRQGQPMLTLMVAGNTVKLAEKRLQHTARMLYERTF